MRKWVSWENLFLLVLLLILIVFKGPVFFKNLSLQGAKTQDSGTLLDLENRPIALDAPYVLVFWATWCGPCEIELKRIQKLVTDGKIKADKIIAVSVDENIEIVRKTALDRGYQFKINWDKDGILSKKYSVVGTPTIVGIDRNDTISWVTTGLSPLLEFKLLKILNEE